MRRNTLADTLCGLLIFLFSYTALNKLAGLQFFKAQLALYPLIGHFNYFISWALPLTEISIALLLFFPVTKIWGLYASTILLAVFSVYLAGITFFYKDLPCSCGGVLRYMTWKQHIIFNCVFIIFAVTGIVVIEKKETKLFIAINRLKSYL